MKALVYTGPEEVTYRDEPDPVAGAGNAIVRIDSVGICGSDMHAFHGNDPRRVPPLILGHEASGVVETGDWDGRRVVINPLISCGRCDDCLGGRSNLCGERQLIGMAVPGAFAERIAIPEANLIPMPDGMDPALAALTEPAATSLHAVNLAARAAHRPLSEARALVLGGGSIGLFAALCLRRHGCPDIALGDTNPLRRQTAESIGVARVYDPLGGSGLPAADAIDVVIDAVGTAATRQAAVAAVRPGGVIIHIGLLDSGGELDVRKMTLAEITFIGTYTYTMVDLRATLEALHSGGLGSLDWIDRRPLSEGLAAFRDLDAGRGAPKIILHPS
ncbi:MAG: alcohol dehydrogenase catalytic domain-containing protein [Inquilinus sp.]|nr:alcohol dehydrogenase catalytic domain-containing protein [Inquilinus sp.]